MEKVGKLKIGILYMVVSMTVLYGCGKNIDPVSQKMINDINALGEITSEDSGRIQELMDVYATLTDEQKNQVSNYVTLLEAKDALRDLGEHEADLDSKEDYYNAIMNALDKGDYVKAKGYYDEIYLSDYFSVLEKVDLEKTIEQEARVMFCFDDLKQYLKNPNSFQLTKVYVYSDTGNTYLPSGDTKKGASSLVILYGSGENSFGGSSTGYFIYNYSNSDDKEWDNINFLGFAKDLSWSEFSKNGIEKLFSYIQVTFTDDSSMNLELNENHKKYDNHCNLKRVQALIKDSEYIPVKIVE